MKFLISLKKVLVSEVFFFSAITLSVEFLVGCLNAVLCLANDRKWFNDRERKNVTYVGADGPRCPRSQDTLAGASDVARLGRVSSQRGIAQSVVDHHLLDDVHAPAFHGKDRSWSKRQWFPPASLTIPCSPVPMSSDARCRPTSEWQSYAFKGSLTPTNRRFETSGSYGSADGNFPPLFPL